MKLLCTLSLVFMMCSAVVYAQTSDDNDLDLIEAEFQRRPPQPPPPPQQNQNDVTVSPEKINGKQAIEKSVNDKKEGEARPEKPSKLSDLSKLQPFTEVSVLQKRYFPKSNRLQIFAGLTANTNDPWNTSFGENLRLGYNFTEAWGIEATGYFMNTSPSQASNDLLSQHGVSAQTFGTMTGYTGAAVVWTPVYGKMSLSRTQIIPFDMYFSLGAGSTTLTGTTISNSTAYVAGTGQIFALTRSWGFRWDLSYTSYSVPSGSANNILLTLGFNLYVPEASYR